MKKQILIDALTLRSKITKGAQIYAINLLRQFSTIESDFEYTVLIGVYTNDAHLPKSNRIHYKKINTHYSTLWRLFYLPQYIKKGNFDLLHLVTEGSTLSDLPIPYILTAHESLKKYYTYSESRKGFFDIKRKVSKIVNINLSNKMIKKADRIIAVSNNTKKDIISEYRLPENDIKVIYEAADDEFFLDEKHGLNKENFKPPYILIFATGDRRENISCEFRAFARIKNEINHYLFIAGIPEGKFQKELEHKCHKFGILERTRFFNFLSRDKLKALYRNADLYIDMSFIEGFGLQVIEAMASGVPVIASDIASVPEIVGNAGILLDPDDDIRLANAMIDILRNNKKKKEMSLASRMQARKFSWKKTAEETLKLYDEVICRRSQ